MDTKEITGAGQAPPKGRSGGAGSVLRRIIVAGAIAATAVVSTAAAVWAGPMSGC